SVPAASDVDGTIDHYTLDDDVAKGVLTFNGNGTYTFDPNGEFEHLAVGDSEDVTFTYHATDNGDADSGVQTVTITVTGVDDTPTVTAALTAAADEGDALFTRDLLSGASDPDDGETATLSVTDVTYTVDSGSPSSTAPAGVSVSGSTLSVDPTNAAFNHLAVGEDQ